jgi:hypothetical protein
MTTDGWYAGEVMGYKVDRVEDDDPAVLAFAVTVRLHPQQKDVVITRRQSDEEQEDDDA